MRDFMRRPLDTIGSALVLVALAFVAAGCLSYVVAGFMPTYEETVEKWGAPGPGEGRLVIMTRVDHSGRIISGAPVFRYTLDGRACTIRDGAFHYLDRSAGAYTFSNGATSLRVVLDEGTTEYVVIAPSGAAERVEPDAALELLEEIKFHPPEPYEREPDSLYCGDYWD